MAIAFILRLLWISAETRLGGAIQGASIPVIRRPPDPVEQMDYG
ncbi:hypothetical protein ABIE60_000823 [Marinobacterium sp. MBR-109]|jgi:hypothetical protein